MTMYRMRQREFVLELLDGVLALRASLLDLAGAAPRDGHGRAHAHAAGAADDAWRTTCSPSIEQLERDAVRLRAAFQTTNRNPLGACAITGTGFPIDRELTSELLGFDGPTGNTYGSIATVDYLLESVSATGGALVGPGPLRAGSAAVGHGRVRLPPLRRRLRAVEQHHAAEAQPGRPRARARHRQQGARAGTGDRDRPCTTRRSATSSTPRTTCSRSCASMFRDAMRAVRLVAAAMQTADVRRRPAEAARRRGRDDGDRAGRHAGARARAAVRDRARDRRHASLKARVAEPDARLAESLAAVCYDA